MLDRWLLFRRINPQARMRLVCFPYAGGGASIFRSWLDYLPGHIELWPVQLPGRENRITEPLFTRIPDLIGEMIPIFLSHSDRPFALFGHSMGAWIAFELAHLLRIRRAREPLCLFVSAIRAPHIAALKPPIHLMPDAKFIEELCHRYQGIPSEVLKNQELLELLLPCLRADVAMVETYAYSQKTPLNCPIFAFGGMEDSTVSHEDLLAWGMHTAAKFTMRTFPGGHFFLRDFAQHLMEAIAESFPGNG